MIPKTLNEWTYEAISTLCAAGQCESDRHDFKFNLPDPANTTKICCAFANMSGGFIVVGIRDKGSKQFEIVGLDPDKELYGTLLSKVKADPDIGISLPKVIPIPNSTKVLYIFEVPQSPVRPHLPTPADQRVFWKRQGSACVQMTLEEIRYQMNTYEEKREKLALLLIDLHHKLRSLEDEAKLPDDNYSGDIFSFEIIDRVVVEAYTLLKMDVNIFGALDILRRRLMLLNVQKQKMLSMLALSYDTEVKRGQTNRCRELAAQALPPVNLLVEQIERSIGEKFGIANPYKAR